MHRTRAWTRRVVVSAALVNVVLHLVLLGSGEATGAMGWLMALGSALCLVCLPSLMARPDAPVPWIVLGTMNVVMVTVRLTAGSLASAFHLAYAPSVLLGSSVVPLSTALSVLEALGALLLVTVLARRDETGNLGLAHHSRIGALRTRATSGVPLTGRGGR